MRYSKTQMIMINFFILLILGLFFCWPYINLFLKRELENDGIAILTYSFALSLGFLSIFLFYLGVFLKSFFDIKVIAFILLAIFLLGNFLKKQKAAKYVLFKREDLPFLILLSFPLFLIFFNSVYYPFVEWDAVTNYSYAAKKIFLYKGLDGFRLPGIPGSFITSYPLLVPLSYVYVYLANGGINEHLAKLIPFLFAVFTLAGTYIIGKTIENKKIGLIAALILSLTPLFLNWAPSGYTDLPAAFFAILTFLSFYLLKIKGNKNFSFVTGLMLGFSAWTKNSGLTLFLSFPLYSFMRFFLSPKKKNILKEEIIDLLKIYFVAFLIAGPWYIRNYLLYKFIFPPIYGAFYNLDRSILNLFLPFLKNPYSFNQMLGLIYTAGFLFYFFSFLKTKREELSFKSFYFFIIGLAGILLILIFNIFTSKPFTRKDIYTIFVCLIFILIYIFYLKSKIRNLFINKKNILYLSFISPLYLIWWYFYSYDTRFILALTPIFAVFAAVFILKVYDNFFKKEYFIIPATLLFLGIIFLENPFLRQIRSVYKKILTLRKVNDDERVIEKIGDSYKVSLYVKKLIKKDKSIRVFSLDNRWISWLGDKHVSEGYPTRLRDLKGYHYFLLTPWAKREYDFENKWDNQIISNLNNKKLFKKEYQEGEFILYKIKGINL